MARKSWKVSEKGMNIQKLESILRSYFEFKSLYESRGFQEFTLDDGMTVNVHDVLKGIDELPPRQKQALVLTCLYGLREVDAAKIMKFPSQWSSPVSSYKKLALEKLLRYWIADEPEHEE